jgi:hypothetical protein
MAQAPRPFALKCEDCIAQNRSFTQTVDGEQQTITVTTAQQVLDYRQKLNVPTREEFGVLPISNQLQLAATLPLFTAPE